MSVVSSPLAVPPPRLRIGPTTSRLFEFLVVGGASLILFPLSWLLQRAFDLEPTEYATGFLFFYAAYLINDPHFAVTYLLFYRNVKARAFSREFSLGQRARYLFSGFVAPFLLIVWAFFALRLQSAEVLGWMIQLMFLLVGWHYVKQGFGVLAVLSARRGVRVQPLERHAVLFHCFAGWAFAWANPAAPSGDFEEHGVIYTAIARPLWFEWVSGGVLAMSVLLLLYVLGRRWLQERRTLPLAPLTGLLITVWLWTIFSNLDPLVRYAIPALHSVQYLYFVWLMKRNEAKASEGPPSFGRPASVQVGVLALSALGLGWILFHGIPSFLDDAFAGRNRTADGRLGATPYFAAFFVFVNVHHYLMDHVIWRRENPQTRFLHAKTSP